MAAPVPLLAWSSALAALAYGALALRLWQLGYARRGAERIQRTVWAATAFGALWGCAGLAAALSATLAATLATTPGSVHANTGGASVALWTLWALWATALLDLARYGAWLLFLLQCLPAPGQRPGTAMAWMRASAALLVGLQLLALTLGALPQAPWVAPLALLRLSQLALPVLALVLLEQVFGNTREDARWAIKPLCLGLLGLLVFDVFLYAQAMLFNQTDADTLAIRGLVHAAVVPLLAVSLVGRNGGLARLRLSPKAAFHSAALLGVGLYLLLLSGVGYYVRYFGGDWGRALATALVFLGLVALTVLLLSSTARARLRVLVGKHLFHYRFDYREEWLRFTRTLAQPSPATEVGQQIIRGLADMLESPSGALWTLARGDMRFRQSARWNQSPVLLHEDIHAPLPSLLAQRGWVVNLDELRQHPARYGHLPLPAWLADAPRAWLVIPLVADQTLIGFCVLDQARTRMDVDWEVNDLLKTAGQQAASYLAQAQSAEALLEARKFEAFNRMSAFVAHDLKNIVTQLALMLGNARRLRDNPAFQEDMLMTIEHALERMRNMLLQLRQPPTPGATGGATRVELGALLQRIAAQCLQARGTPLAVQCPAHLPVRAHAEHLERVLGHLVHNALDATASAGQVWVQAEREGTLARICVGDTGGGMSPAFVQNQLFKPFQSTKPAGMGLGAFESLQYVRELGGSLAVDSTEGQGTRMTLELPLFEEAADTAVAPSMAAAG